jgi:hypothetical protein
MGLLNPIEQLTRVQRGSVGAGPAPLGGGAAALKGGGGTTCPRCGGTGVVGAEASQEPTLRQTQPVGRAPRVSGLIGSF